ncbi:hypothetical protein ACPB8Q_05660 [Methanocaldococcus indicus]|uniref:hypothetical protein n=1 Tax=Methanocaldococcus indicus TaxID=213231 RepID=UPI003C6DA969
MVVLTKKRDYNLIKNDLLDDMDIHILSCGICAKICKTGDINSILQLTNFLKKFGYNVSYTIINGICYKSIPQNIKEKNIIVLSCGIGFRKVRKLFKDKNVVCGLITIGVSSLDKKILCLCCGKCPNCPLEKQHHQQQ